VDRNLIVSLTPSAASYIKSYIKSLSKTGESLKLSVKSKGCSGLSYHLSNNDLIDPKDEVINQHDSVLYLDYKSIIFLMGIIIDFESTPFKSGLVFNNPNEKSKCGCGASFSV
jgi:iron-sulfur cluster assembly protein